MRRLSSRCTGLFSILTLTSVRCLAAGRRGTTAVIISRPYWCRPGEGQSAVNRRYLEGSEPRYYLSNAPEDTMLETLAYVGGSRWRIETEFDTEKGDVGLDEYETRSWAGWHHHIAMCLLGGAFLLGLQQDWGGGERCPGSPGPRCTGWCVRCCPGNCSGPGNCCCGWRTPNGATSVPSAPTRSAALPFTCHQPSVREPSL